LRAPQVSDRIREAPAQALRGVFAGIGQLLLITDKLRNKPPASQQVPQARAPEPSETRAEPASPPVASVPADPPVSAAPPTPAAPAAPEAPAGPTAPTAERVPEARDFDKTGNVRLLTSAKAAADGTAPTAGAAASVAEATVAEAGPVTPAAKAAPGGPLPK